MIVQVASLGDPGGKAARALEDLGSGARERVADGAGELCALACERAGHKEGARAMASALSSMASSSGDAALAAKSRALASLCARAGRIAEGLGEMNSKSLLPSRMSFPALLRGGSHAATQLAGIAFESYISCPKGFKGIENALLDAAALSYEAETGGGLAQFAEAIANGSHSADAGKAADSLAAECEEGAFRAYSGRASELAGRALSTAASRGLKTVYESSSLLHKADPEHALRKAAAKFNRAFAGIAGLSSTPQFDPSDEGNLKALGNAAASRHPALFGRGPAEGQDASRLSRFLAEASARGAAASAQRSLLSDPDLKALYRAQGHAAKELSLETAKSLEGETGATAVILAHKILCRDASDLSEGQLARHALSRSDLSDADKLRSALEDDIGQGWQCSYTGSLIAMSLVKALDAQGASEGLSQALTALGDKAARAFALPEGGRGAALDAAADDARALFASMGVSVSESASMRPFLAAASMASRSDAQMVKELERQGLLGNTVHADTLHRKGKGPDVFASSGDPDPKAMREKLLSAMNGGEGRTDLVELSRQVAAAKVRSGLSGRLTGDAATANAERAVGKAAGKPLAPDLKAAFDSDDLLLYGAGRRSWALRGMSDGALMRDLEDMVGARDRERLLAAARSSAEASLLKAGGEPTFPELYEGTVNALVKMGMDPGAADLLAGGLRGLGRKIAEAATSAFNSACAFANEAVKDQMIPKEARAGYVSARFAAISDSILASLEPGQSLEFSREAGAGFKFGKGGGIGASLGAGVLARISRNDAGQAVVELGASLKAGIEAELELGDAVTATLSAEIGALGSASYSFASDRDAAWFIRKAFAGALSGADAALAQEAAVGGSASASASARAELEVDLLSDAPEMASDAFQASITAGASASGTIGRTVSPSGAEDTVEFGFGLSIGIEAGLVDEAEDEDEETGEGPSALNERAAQAHSAAGPMLKAAEQVAGENRGDAVDLAISIGRAVSEGFSKEASYEVLAKYSVQRDPDVEISGSEAVFTLKDPTSDKIAYFCKSKGVPPAASRAIASRLSELTRDGGEASSLELSFKLCDEACEAARRAEVRTQQEVPMKRFVMASSAYGYAGAQFTLEGEGAHEASRSLKLGIAELSYGEAFSSGMTAAV